MKTFIYFLQLLFLLPAAHSQDINNSGLISICGNAMLDLNGDGLINSNDNSIPAFNFDPGYTGSASLLSFSSMWESPAGAFTNCWDGAVGYFDGDTLLDVAGYTFSPAKFYIYEQTPGSPGSFTLVQEFIKAEGGSFGPIVTGDTDGDGKIELISPDVLGIARVYIYECDRDNMYSAQPTFSHPSNSQGGQGVYMADLNKNGKKEIIVLRGTTGGGEVKIWEHSGAVGTNTYTNIYSYTTPTYIFSKGGLGDADNDGWDEIFITYGGLPTFNTFIRRIEFDSATSSFQHLQFEAPSVGFPANYKTYDLDNDGIKELIMTGNSNSRAACYVFRRSGSNSFVKIDSVFEASDNNNMLSCDIKVLGGNSQPTLLMGSFNGRLYTYQYNGSSFIKDYENLNYPGAAIRRVLWLPTASYDGYFNTWSGSNSNGTFYIFKKDGVVGINQTQTPSGFKLYQNYPNPFNPATKIKVDLPPNALQNSPEIIIYNVLGAEVRSYKLSKAGEEITVDGRDLAAGIYFYSLKAGSFTDTKKMMLVK